MKTADQKKQPAARPPDAKQRAKAFFREVGIVFGAFLVLNSFVLASFEVPTGSMENEIMTGDFLLVNKFIFGGTTPRTIPFTNIRLPAFKLPSFWEPERGDVIVFIFPGMREEAQAKDFAYYLKRAIAVAGDTLEIKNRIVRVNGRPMVNPRNIKYNYSSIRPAEWHDPRIFPSGAPWNEDSYGPVRIPKKGDVIHLNAANFTEWEVFIRREGHEADRVDGDVYVDGKKADTYTVKRDYVFGMGDNRDNSLDSRFWGFIPVEDIIGAPLIVYWSWNPDIPFSSISAKLASIRFGRFGSLVR